MKKIVFALTMLAFAVTALPQARGDDISIDFIYDNLSGGNWIDVDEYGYGWQPDLATSDPNWRPYSDGYWAYTDYGWTWISYEDFGWATYHYGRWANLGDYGWVWFPGSDLDWGPAWVSWRTGGDYIGWAPLPPLGPGVVYESQPIGANVDVVFDIGPEYYNFCDVRFIGEPVLRDRIFPPVQNITYITNTVNVTNITVQNNVVYNYGPDFNVVNTYSSRPIQRLAIERQAPANLTTAVKSGTLTKVQGNKLLVAAPQKLTKAAPTARPPAVKAKVAQPKIERGWKGVSNKAELEQKIKTENPKNVPPPTRAAAREASSPPSAGGASPAGAGRAPVVAPSPRGKQGRLAPGATAAPSLGVSPTPSERGKGRRGARPRPGATAMPGDDAGRMSPPPGTRATGASPKREVNPRQTMRQSQDEPGSENLDKPTFGERFKMNPGETQGAKERGQPGPGQGTTGRIPPQDRDQAPKRQRFGTPAPRQTGTGLDKPTFGEKSKPGSTSQANTERELMDILSEGRRNIKKEQPGYEQPGTAPKGGPGQGSARQIPPQGGDQAPQRQRFGTPPPAGGGEHDQRSGGPSSGVHQPVNPPGGGGPAAEARGQRERGQGVRGQAQAQQQDGGAPTGAEHRQGQARPEGGKKKAPKETPPPVAR